MLIKFCVSNFRSIKEELSLDLQINPFIKEFPENTIESKIKNVKDLHKCSVIYGVNSAGKSNTLLALDFMKDFILSGHKQTYDDPIETQPFLLDAHSKEEDSFFSIEFIHDKIRYEYSFSLNHQRVTSETLVAYPNKAKQTWYTRVFDKTKNDFNWSFGAHFKGEKDTTRKRTLENTLFLSKAAQDAHELITPIIDFFKYELTIHSGPSSEWSTKRFLQDPEGKKKVTNLFKKFDFGIEDIFNESQEIKDDQIPDFFPEELKNKIKSDPITNLKTKSVRKIPNSDEMVIFDFFKNESFGAKKLFNLAAPIFITLELGGTLIIDEIENNLHTKLVDYIINMFLSNKVNINSAQLIFTTHNPTILETIQLRRDQLNFATLNEEKSTILYNLSRIKKFQSSFKQVRKGTNLLKSYLEGNFYTPPSLDEQITFDDLLIQDKTNG